MNFKRLLVVVMASGALLVPAAANAAVTLNPDGTGFVGKGDVQLVYGWNNPQLQANADLVGFRSTAITERTWECTNSNNQKIQERERTITSTSLVSSVARVRNQVTGFNLTGFSGDPVVSTDGPALNSCPAAPSTWALTSPAGDPVNVGGSFSVSIDGTNWHELAQN